MIRFATRYIQHSIGQVVQTFLDEYSWTGATPPFGTSSVDVKFVTPKPSDLEVLHGNTVFVSFGDEPDHRPQELGGGMLRIEHVFFVDILGVDESISLALASDIKDRLTGLFGGTRYLRPKDPATGAELPGYLGEFTDVARSQPDGERNTWYVVNGTCVMDFPGEES